MPAHDRRLAPSPFPDDDGRATETTRAALAAASTGDAPGYLRAVCALCADRLLVAVVATATRTGTATTGMVSDKEAEMSVVLIEGPAGRALPAFTGLDALQTWRADARPVPVTLDLVAQTAMAEHASAVVIDVASPYRLVIEGDVLAALAQGHRLVELDDGGFGWAVADPVSTRSGGSPRRT